MTSSSSKSAYAELQIISYKDLESRQPESLKKIFSACQEDGFFYLDLIGTAKSNFLRTVSDVVTASQSLFDLPLAEKMTFDTNKLGSLKNYGYKPIGRNTGVIKGKQDGHEIFLAPRDTLLKLGDHSDGLSYPAKLQNDIPLLETFSAESHQICLTILACLSTMLNCGSLTEYHLPDKTSTSATALIKYPAQKLGADQGGHIAHTDVGSLTLLFCEQTGLQVLRSAADDWINVKPVPGYAIVNIGDSLRHMSGRVFKSCLHRVLCDPAGQDRDRFSTIYFLRPQTDATFRDENGKEWKSIDWHVRKFDAFRHSKAEEVERLLKGES